MMRIFTVFLFLFSLLANAQTNKSTLFLEEFPHLKKDLYEEPDNRLRFGFGLIPVQFMKNKAGVGVNIIQIHWMPRFIDWEVLGVSYSATVSGEPVSQINLFTFKTSPKIKITENISIGPVFGQEFVSFPLIKARLYKEVLFTPEEAFSTRGPLFGLVLSETFKLGEKYMIKVNQMAYRQNYKTDGTNSGWKYYYTSDEALNKSQKPISPGIVFLMDVSFIF